MILYFSGTGNSRFVATELGRLLGIGTASMTDVATPRKIEASDDSLTVFVFPTYAWGVPPVVIDFITGLTDSACRKLSVSRITGVATCGDETAMTPEMFAKALSKSNLQMNAFFTVIMPNNYVLLPGFDVDAKDVEESKLQAAPERIHHIAGMIEGGFSGLDITRGSWPRLKTRVVYPLFRRFGIYPSKWRADNGCISCGQCASACPVGNIEMKSGRPVWGKECTSCLACYHICPRHAVRYSRATRCKGQYFFKSR